MTIDFSVQKGNFFNTIEKMSLSSRIEALCLIPLVCLTVMSVGARACGASEFWLCRCSVCIYIFMMMGSFFENDQHFPTCFLADKSVKCVVLAAHFPSVMITNSCIWFSGLLKIWRTMKVSGRILLWPPGIERCWNGARHSSRFVSDSGLS